MNTIPLLSSLLACTMLLLSACSVPVPNYTPKPYTPTVPPTPSQTQHLVDTQQKAIQALLALANTTTSPQREFYQLQAAYLLAEQQQTAEALQLISQINHASLNSENQYLYELVSIDIVRQQGQTTQAMDVMHNLQAPMQVNDTIQIISFELQSNLYADSSNNLAAARERITLDSLLTDPTAQNHNRQQIWNLVYNLPVSTLLSAQQNSGTILDGWLNLAEITHQYTNASELNNAIQQWRTEYPKHPANSILNVEKMTPAAKSTEAFSAYNKYDAISGAEEIALLLPVSGNLSTSATSIRDGFFTAYNALHGQHGQPVNIKVYDTQSDQQAAKSYAEAVRDGAELVVGPLTKAGVDQINKLNRLPVPVIALNDAYSKNRHRGQLFEFGLAPEDEARKAAQYAYQQGQRRALLFVQADEWGRRVAQAFFTEWEALGGTITNQIVFEAINKMAQLVRQGLRIHLTAAQKDDSNQRPSMRSDVDMIFLAAYPSSARQIKPLLDYYYASHIKVYGTSSIYELPPNVSSDKDLNGVNFCDMPWLLTPEKAEPQLHATINELWPATASSYARFYALGIDAYQLTLYIQGLQSRSITPINGVTGSLRLTNNDRIERDVVCTIFQQGKPVLQ